MIKWLMGLVCRYEVNIKYGKYEIVFYSCKFNSIPYLQKVKIDGMFYCELHRGENGRCYKLLYIRTSPT